MLCTGGWVAPRRLGQAGAAGGHPVGVQCRLGPCGGAPLAWEGAFFFFFFIAFVASPSQPTPPVMAASHCGPGMVGQGPLPGLGGLGAWGNCLGSHRLLLIIWFWLCFHPFPLQNTSGAALIPLVVSLPQVARRGTRAGWWPGRAWQACWWPLWRLQKHSCIL